MRLRSAKRTAFRAGAFDDSSDLNPWSLLVQHMDAVSPRSGAAGFRTNQTRHANRHFDAERGVGETFLANTRMHRHRPEWSVSAIEYFSSQLGPVIARSGSESVDARSLVALPDPGKLPLAFDQLLARRRSVRQFSGDPLSLGEVATILHASCGISHEAAGVALDRLDRQYPLRFRSVPSAGGLYAVDTYCVALNVRGLQFGVYQYRPYEHALALIDVPSSPQAVRESFMPDFGGVDLEKVSTIFLYAGSPQKVMRKYGDRGVRYLFIEAGMIALAANLAATALGWGVLDYQSYYEPEIESLLRFRNQQQYVLHAVLLGWPVA